jgi:hypothetical protein
LHCRLRARPKAFGRAVGTTLKLDFNGRRADRRALTSQQQQDHLEERDNDEIVHNNETDKEHQECPAEEVTDRTDDTNNGISWNYSEERDNNEDGNMSWEYSEERDDNKDGNYPDNNNRVTLPTNAVALHRKALPPP